MRNFSAIGLVLLWACTLISGCGRKNETTSKDTALKPQTAAVRDLASPSPRGEGRLSNATPMVQIPGGKFTMGEKSEVDAPPHEVVVAPFMMDRHLVTQDQFQIMGAN